MKGFVWTDVLPGGRWLHVMIIYCLMLHFHINNHTYISNRVQILSFFKSPITAHFKDNTVHIQVILHVNLYIIKYAFFSFNLCIASFNISFNNKRPHDPHIDLKKKQKTITYHFH